MNETRNSRFNMKAIILGGLAWIAFQIVAFPTICQFVLPLFTSYPLVEGIAFMRWDIVISDVWGLQLFAGINFGLLAILMMMASGKKHNKTLDSAGKPLSTGTGEYGSARLLTYKELNKLYKSYTQKESSVISKEQKPGGIIVNSEAVDKTKFSPHKDLRKVKLNDNDLKIHYNDEKIHHGIIGSTGSGKTTNFIGPSILSIANSQQSMCITDPKGELYTNYHKYLEERGYDVQVLNFVNPSAGQNFNQLEYINKQYSEGMPYLLQSKALRAIIKYAAYMKTDSPEFTPKLYGYENRVLPPDASVGRTKVENTFDFGELSLVSAPMYRNVINTGNGEIIVKFLREVFTRTYESSYKAFKDKAKITEDNIYLHYRQEQVVVTGIQILSSINRETIIKYFKDRISYYTTFKETISQSSSLYLNAENKIKEFNSYLESIEAQSGFSTDLLIKYLQEFESEANSIFSKYEQEAVSFAQSMAAMIIESGQTGSRGDSIWIETPKAFLASLILFVCRESHMDFSKHLGSVYRMMSELAIPIGPKTDKTYIDTIFDSFLPNDAIKLAQTSSRVAGDKTKTSIMVSTIQPMQLWADERVVSQCSRTSFDVRNIVEKPTAIFLNIPGPDTQPTYTILASLFIEQLYVTLVDYAKQTKDLTLPRAVYFILDEFGNLPKIPNFGSKISLARSYNIRFNYVIQDLEQLDLSYKMEKATILGNSSIIYMLTNNLDTAKWVSDRLGKYTAEVESSSSSENQDKGSTTSASTSKFGRELYTPQELMDDFPKFKGIYIAPRQSPAYVDLYPSYYHPMSEYINSIRVDDLQIERPVEEINYFSPKDFNKFICAYKLFWNDSIIDSYFHKMIQPKERPKNNKKGN